MDKRRRFIINLEHAEEQKFWRVRSILIASSHAPPLDRSLLIRSAYPRSDAPSLFHARILPLIVLCASP